MSKTILLTGGAGGLGFAMAQQLSEEGHNLIVFDIQQKPEDWPEHIQYIQTDITDKPKVQGIINELPSIDALINNAGVIFNEPLINLTTPPKFQHDLTRFQDNLKINLESVFIMSSIVAEKMVMSRTQSVIINISSISACGNAGQTAYSAAKAAVNAMTKTWSKELGPLGIRSVAIAPGFINTPSTHKALTEETLKHIKENTPLRRLGKPSDIVNTINFIMNTPFINGTVIEVDGGLSF